MVIISKTRNGPRKILFLCFGYSIHAYRRIKIFVDDPAYSVSVASTYNYNFKNAINIHLKTPLYGKSQSDPDNSDKPDINKPKTFFSLILSLLSKIPFLFNSLLFIYDIVLFIRHLWILKRNVNKIKPDVIFLQTLLYPSYLSFFLPKRIPIIVTFWNGDIIWWAKWNGIERFFKKKIVKYGVKRATAITVNSQTALDICLSYGIEIQKVNLIRYPGIDLSVMKKWDKGQSRKDLNINTKKIILCPRGYKAGQDSLNNDIIIRAAKELINQYNDILFLFVGINLNNEWVQLCGSAENQQFITNFRNDGCVDWNKMATYYSAADLVISLSSYDSQPNCMLETMACKSPVIMGDIPQIREWVVDGENGFIVPCRDSDILAQAIDKVFNLEPEELDRITESAYGLVTSRADQQKNSDLVKKLVLNI